MVILYIYSTCWCMKLVFYECQHPLGRVTLPVTFGDFNNYHTNMLVFEVVNFSSPYHIILGR
jgi:hypothetical protein